MKLRLKALFALPLLFSITSYASHEMITTLGGYNILSDAHSSATTLSASGNAVGGGLNEYGGAYLELFPASATDGSYAGGTSSLDADTRTLTMSVQDMGNGVTMQRKVYVPLDGAFIRWVNTIINTSGTDATAVLGIAGTLSGTSSVTSTSDSDATAEVTDYWVATHDGSSTNVAHVMNGSATADPLSHINFSGNNVDWGYSLNIPAGATVVVMHFSAAVADADLAQAYSDALANGTAHGALDNLSGAELAQLASEYPAAGSVDGGGGGGTCFIATAAYGTPMAQEINTLRAVRDTYMLNNVLGTAFVDTYYRLSPPIANKVAEYPMLASAVRMVLTPFVLLGKLILAMPMALLTTLLVGAGLALSRRQATRHQS